MDVELYKYSVKEGSFIAEKTGDMLTLLGVIGRPAVKSEAESVRKLSFDYGMGRTVTVVTGQDPFEFLNSETRNKKNCEGIVRSVLLKAKFVSLLVYIII